MKKLSLSLLILLILTACGTSNNATPASSPQSGSSLPAATQLILGTLKLEGTPQSVTAKQAAELLPLWQTMKVLSESDTAAQQEKDALLAQIQEAMTAEQRQAIQAMNLSRQDMASLMQQQGTGSGSQSGSSQSGTSTRSGNAGFRPGAGGPPDEVRIQGGGGGFGGGQNLSREQIATAQAARQASSNVIPPALLNAVIEYLQKKTGS